MTITNEMKRAVELAGIEPVPVQDPETGSTYFIIREDVYRKMQELVRDPSPHEYGDFHNDRSLYEYGEFRPKK